MNEVPTYQPPEGVHGPTLGRDLPDGCERASAYMAPDDRRSSWLTAGDGVPMAHQIYWWRFPPLRVGDPTPDGTRRVWTCKVGGTVANLPGGSDLPMRKAVAEAFTELTGQPVEFCFSGWGDDLDESELAVVEDRAPDPEVIRAALAKRLEALPNPEPPATDELRERIARAMFDRDGFAVRWDEASVNTTARYSRLADAVLAVLPKPPDGCEAVFLPTDVVDHYVSAEPPAGRWERQASFVVNACREAQARRGTATTPPPAPPWPGAVLSGLTDEDGVPTWLAQAGQVRGEQVRACTSVPWLPNTSYGEDEWVEVRAPRPAPEPETERVPVWEAVDRWMPGGRVICGWQWSTQTRDGSVTHDDGTFTPVHDAPTVEVLKDGNP